MESYNLVSLVVVCISISFLFIVDNIPWCCTMVYLFMHQFKGRLGCFQVLTIMNKAVNRLLPTDC